VFICAVLCLKFKPLWPPSCTHAIRPELRRGSSDEPCQNGSAACIGKRFRDCSNAIQSRFLDKQLMPVSKAAQSGQGHVFFVDAATLTTLNFQQFQHVSQIAACGINSH
jgi:hypothetical protein